MHPGLTRRGALGGAAALALASCGGGDPAPGGGASGVAGAGTLKSLAAFEHAAVAAWAAIAERLGGEARRYAEAIRERERRHVERLSELIRELGEEPPEGRAPEEYAPQFPRMRGDADALAFAADLEGRLVRGYLDGLHSLGDPRQRRTAADIVAEEAEDLAVVRVLAGGAAAPAPYVTGTL